MTIRTLTSLRSQNKKPIRVISSLVIAIGMMFSAIMPFVDYEVKADNVQTYREVGANVCIESIDHKYAYSWTSDVRIVMLKNESGTKIKFYMISTSPFLFKTKSKSVDAACAVGATGLNGQQKTYEGVTYYDYGAPNYNVSELNGYPDTPVVIVSDSTLNDANASYKAGYDHTYGSRAVGPEEPWTYGELKDLTYSTSIIGSGGGSGEANKDTISWYPFADSNSKMFGAQGVVDLRVVPGDYISGTQEGLLAQEYSDFILDVASAGHLATVSAYSGSYTVTWGEVMSKLSLAWPALQLIWDGSYWTKIGWVYQARYHSEDAPEDSWSEWQTVYTITSSSPTGTDGLDPSDGTALPGFYENVVDSFNTTSIVNNNVNNIYYVNNIPILTNEDEEPDEDPTDYNPILKEMRDILLQIRYMIMNINNAGDEDDPEDTGLKDADDELHRQEELLINDMDDKLGDIDTDVELLNDNGFLSAANWVRVQYDRITLNSPFELLIVFSLVLGIALIFIGKVR